jgi:hypothetical protein
MFDPLYDNNHYYGWKIINNKYSYNTSIYDDATLLHNKDTNIISKLSYCKIDDYYQYVLISSNNIIYNTVDNIIIENIEDKKNIKILNNNGSIIVDIINNDEFLIARDIGDNIIIYDLHNFEVICTMYCCYTNCMSLSHNNKYFIAGGKRLILYNMEDLKLIQSFKINKEIIKIAICDKHIVTINKDNMIIVYSIYGIELFAIHEFDNNDNNCIQYLNYSHDENYLYYGNYHELIIYETNNYNTIKKYNLENVISYYLIDDDYRMSYTIFDESITNVQHKILYLPKYYQLVRSLLMEHFPEELIDIIINYIK